jgi:hypothetical protein
VCESSRNKNGCPKAFAFVDGTSHGRIDLIKMEKLGSFVDAMLSNFTEEFVWQAIERSDEGPTMHDVLLKPQALLNEFIDLLGHFVNFCFQFMNFDFVFFDFRPCGRATGIKCSGGHSVGICVDLTYFAMGSSANYGCGP